MSRTSDDEAAEAPHPRETTVLFGHGDAERALLDAYRGGRIPHAWLIGGMEGIGKATLAYRMARFVLAYPNPSADGVQSASSLALSDDHSVLRRVTAQGHPDLLVLERTPSDSGAMRSVIVVEQVARTVSFFGSTAGEGGWRVCIVDSVDELNAAGANKLLKVLEEPPPRSLFLLVSHAPGRLLATIRSRCRRLALRPLEQGDVAKAVAAALGGSETDSDIRAAAAAAEGSVGRALNMLGGPALKVREQVQGMLDALPAVDPRALHALGDTLADDAAFAAFIEVVQRWMSARLDVEPQDRGRLARVAEVWEKVARTAREVEVFNLERKPMVFTVFGWLAESARR